MESRLQSDPLLLLLKDKRTRSRPTVGVAFFRTVYSLALRYDFVLFSWVDPFAVIGSRVRGDASAAIASFPGRSLSTSAAPASGDWLAEEANQCFDEAGCFSTRHFARDRGRLGSSRKLPAAS